MSKPYAERPYDLIVYGATSFVGRILSHFLLERHGEQGDLTWAIAGRSADKLDALKAELGAAGLPTLVAEATDLDALETLAGQTRVVVSTVGPYALYGSTLVGVCAALGTDYCDLTGETQWMRRMIDEHEETARESGARIVHNCGFDSIPSDLGVWFTQQQAEEAYGQPCRRIRMCVKAAKGGASGGTVASLINVMKEAARDPELRKLLQNPHALAPASASAGVRQPNVTSPEYDPDIGGWLAPFVMAAINTRVVHRSHALLGHPWGEDFLYDEAMLMGRGMRGRMRALGLTAGLGGFIGLAALPPSRWLLERYLLPKPGEGPSPEAQKSGFYDLRFYGWTADGQHIKTRVTGDRDPGYGSTGKMLGEAAVCLGKDISREQLGGGFWTPATAFDGTLIERLHRHAGMSFERLE